MAGCSTNITVQEIWSGMNISFFVVEEVISMHSIYPFCCMDFTKSHFETSRRYCGIVTATNSTEKGEYKPNKF